MNIMFCCDRGYAMPLTVCITSAFENNKESDVHIYVLHSGISDEQQKILHDLAKSYNQEINLIKVDSSYFYTAPTLRWSKEAYYRLLINEYIPKDVERIIYLDCDTVSNKPLNDLYNLDLEENCIAALEEENHKYFRTRLGLSPTGKYFQSGVLLMDLNKCREIISYEKVLETINNLGDRLLVVDQDVMNVMLDGKIKALDKRFNNCEVTNFEYSRGLSKKGYELEISETYILHYASGKPWNNIYSGSCEEIWYKYLRISPYHKLYYQKYDGLKYKFLRTKVVKWFFYQYIHLTPTVNTLFLKLLPSKWYFRLRNYYRKKLK